MQTVLRVDLYTYTPCLHQRLWTSCSSTGSILIGQGWQDLTCREWCWQVQEVWQHPDRLDAAVSTKRGLGGNSPFWLLNQTGVGVAIWLGPDDDVKGGNASNGGLSNHLQAPQAKRSRACERSLPSGHL